MFNLGLRFRIYGRYLLTVLSPKIKLPVNVLTNEETVDYILKNSSSVVRFGEGEVQLMNGGNLDFQIYDPILAEKMLKVLSVQSTEQFVVCVPDVFHDLGRFRLPVRLWWKQHLQRYQQFYREKYTSGWYGSAFISRPYMDWKRGTVSNLYFEKLKQIWNGRDLLIVEGRYSRSGVGNDLFDNARSVQRILCPSQNAFSVYEEIKACTEQYADGKMVLVMLGPTAKVLAYDLFLDGYRALDLGHIDSEYEWFKLGTRKKVKLANKHTAELNYDNDIGEMTDKLYQSQIIADLTSE